MEHIRTDNRITEKTSLGELLTCLGSVTRAGKTPTSKALRKHAGDPFIRNERCRVYANGYAVYVNSIGQTVIWLPDCSSFMYRFNKMKVSEMGNEIENVCKLPAGLLESLPWMTAITLIGEHRIEKLAMCRKGDRKQNKSLIRGDNEEGDALEELEGPEDGLVKEYFWREDQMGDDPEMIFIRKECRQSVLASMTMKQSEVFILYYQYGYNQYEIAEMLYLDQSSVRDRLYGAQKKFKKMITDTPF